MSKKLNINEIKTILRIWGFSRHEARVYIRNLRKEAKMNEAEFIHTDDVPSDEQSSD